MDARSFIFMRQRLFRHPAGGGVPAPADAGPQGRSAASSRAPSLSRKPFCRVDHAVLMLFALPPGASGCRAGIWAGSPHSAPHPHRGTGRRGCPVRDISVTGIMQRFLKGEGERGRGGLFSAGKSPLPSPANTLASPSFLPPARSRRGKGFLACCGRFCPGDKGETHVRSVARAERPCDSVYFGSAFRGVAARRAPACPFGLHRFHRRQHIGGHPFAAA